MLDRAAAHELIYQALYRWDIDQECGGSSDLAEWVDEYLDEREVGLDADS